MPDTVAAVTRKKKRAHPSAGGNASLPAASAAAADGADHDDPDRSQSLSADLKEDADHKTHDDDNSDGDSDGESNGPLDLVDVEFDFQSFGEIDFHGVKNLARQAFLGTELETSFDLSGLADAVVAQPRIGTAVKVDDTVDPYAAMSVLSFRAHKDLLAPVAKLVTSAYKPKSDAPKALSMAQVLKDCHVGYLVNERLVNMPFQIVPELFRILLDELKSSPFPAGKLDYLLVLSKTYTEVSSSSGGLEQPIKKKKKRSDTRTVFHVQPEDDIFKKYCDISVEIPMLHASKPSKAAADEDDSGESVVPGKQAYLVPFAKVAAVLADMKATLI